jgi:ATP-dependent DNA helicase RecG
MEFPFSKGYLSLLDEYNAGKKLDDGSPKGSPKTEERIVDLMLNHPQISTEAIADILKISKRAVLKQTKKLQELGVISHVGPARGGHWEVLKK